MFSWASFFPSFSLPGGRRGEGGVVSTSVHTFPSHNALACVCANTEGGEKFPFPFLATPVSREVGREKGEGVGGRKKLGHRLETGEV